MNAKMQLHKLLLRTAAVAGTVALVGAGVALAAKAPKPLKGATYSGTFTGEVYNTISFKVSSNGKKVSGFNIPSPPVGCQGGAFGSATGGTATVSKKGTFKVTLNIVFAPQKKTNGTVLVTGKFGKHGSESGTLSSTFTGKDFTTSCNATKSYSTKG
ncbi:MAG TPA: hypothetical protein VGP17_03035 [Solirubrobacteraceae bacterium]|jgi:hypothetical protein|nr:hypothetical protein [Solirubrobacteraceae bacterium]